MFTKRAAADDDAFADVPPSVLCAVCGRPQCGGCSPIGADGRVASAVVAVVRIPDNTLSDLLIAGSSHPAAFVRTMDGRSMRKVLQFAILCEAAAALQVTSSIALSLRWLLGPVSALRIVCATAGATAVLTAVLVAGHGLWGVAVYGHDRTRALRFGLATCAWDLALSPLGIALMAPRLGLGIFPLLRRAALGLPGATSGAFLDFVGVDDAGERLTARRRSFVAAAAATVGGALVALAALGSIVLAWWV